MPGDGNEMMSTDMQSIAVHPKICSARPSTRSAAAAHHPHNHLSPWYANTPLPYAPPS